MLALNDVPTPNAEPDLSESYSRTVEAPAPAARTAAASIDAIGPLVEGLIAVGVEDHIVTPCGDGLVWRFGPAEAGRLRLAWEATVAAETDDASLVTISLRATASDAAARERLLEAWPVLGPIAELHARRLLHRIEALAEDTVEDEI